MCEKCHNYIAIGLFAILGDALALMFKTASGPHHCLFGGIDLAAEKLP